MNQIKGVKSKKEIKKNIKKKKKKKNCMVLWFLVNSEMTLKNAANSIFAGSSQY